MALAGGKGGSLVEFQPMSPEEIERTVQFLLSQQAQFAADSAANQARWDANLERLSAKTDRLTEGLIGLTSIVGQLASAQQRTDEQLTNLGEHIKTVDSNLNILIQVFERHLREDHGRAPS